MTTHVRMRLLSPEWRSWRSMKTRCCLKLKRPEGKRYWSNGITVCDRWLESFANFLADMGPRPEGTTLDRINNAGNYEPGNCRWATKDEQANNQTSNVILEFNGERQTVSRWARHLGIGVSTIRFRLRSGWSVERALTTPVGIIRRGELIDTAILTAEQIPEIRADARKVATVAADYGVSWDTINRIKRRESWSHIP